MFLTITVPAPAKTLLHTLTSLLIVEPIPMKQHSPTSALPAIDTVAETKQCFRTIESVT